MIVDDLLNNFTEEQIILIEDAIDSNYIQLYESYEDLFNKVRRPNNEEHNNWIINHSEKKKPFIKWLRKKRGLTKRVIFYSYNYPTLLQESILHYNN